jgi:hypothetical protein
MSASVERRDGVVSFEGGALRGVEVREGGRAMDSGFGWRGRPILCCVVEDLGGVGVCWDWGGGRRGGCWYVVMLDQVRNVG